MCSIAGWYSTHPLDPTVATRLAGALLFYGARRGNQSAGIATEAGLVKRAMAPERFRSIRAFLRLMEQPTKWALLHTRMPTSGGLGDAQAQPFQCGAYIGIHNGCVSGEQQLRNKWGIDNPTGVDSELIFQYLAKHGHEDYHTFIRDLPGSAATAFVHDNKMFLCRDRNPTETCSIELHDGNKITLFASTEAQLLSAMHYNWLIDMRSNSTPWCSLLSVTGEGVEVVKSSPTTSYGSGGYSSGYSNTPTANQSSSTRMRCRWDNNFGCLVDVNTGEPVGFCS